MDRIPPERQAEYDRIMAECARLGQEACKGFLGMPAEWNLDEFQRAAVEKAVAAALRKGGDGESAVPLPTGLTAGDLRKSGAQLPENIPDCAEVWARDVRFKVDRQKSTQTEIVGVHEFIGAEFRWVEQTIMMEKVQREIPTCLCGETPQ